MRECLLFILWKLFLGLSWNDIGQIIFKSSRWFQVPIMGELRGIWATNNDSLDEKLCIEFGLIWVNCEVCRRQMSVWWVLSWEDHVRKRPDGQYRGPHVECSWGVIVFIPRVFDGSGIIPRTLHQKLLWLTIFLLYFIRCLLIFYDMLSISPGWVICLSGCFLASGVIGKPSKFSLPLVNTINLHGIDVGVGDPPNVHRLAIALGTSNTLIGAEVPYVPTKTTVDLKRPFQIDHMYGKASGKWVNDTISLGSGTGKIVLPNIMVGDVTSGSFIVGPFHSFSCQKRRFKQITDYQCITGLWEMWWNVYIESSGWHSSTPRKRIRLDTDVLHVAS